MKKIFVFLSLFIVATLACNLSINLAPTSEVPTVVNSPVLIEPATTTPEIFISLTQAMPATALPTTVQVSVWPLAIALSPAIASGVRGEQVPLADGQDLPYWGKTPGHTEVKLEGYVLQGKFHQPQIYVYPASAYAELVPSAFESIHRLDNILYGPNGPSLPADINQLPTVPFFNAAQAFASNAQIISFQNGSGVRFVTEYAQYAAPVNNHELFYHFQGVTRDGAYYIIAILPITAPGLAETSDAGAAIPLGGIVYPDINSLNPDFPSYYGAVTNLLNTTSPEAFTPSLSQLDALIQSMQITP